MNLGKNSFDWLRKLAIFDLNKEVIQSESSDRTCVLPLAFYLVPTKSLCRTLVGSLFTVSFLFVCLTKVPEFDIFLHFSLSQTGLLLFYILVYRMQMLCLFYSNRSKSLQDKISISNFWNIHSPNPVVSDKNSPKLYANRKDQFSIKFQSPFLVIDPSVWADSIFERHLFMTSSMFVKFLSTYLGLYILQIRWL